MSDENSTQNQSHTDLSQVRDLLFGEQVREIESKFESRISYLENCIRDEMDSIRQSLDTKISELDSNVREHISSVDQRLGSDNHALSESLKGVAHQLTCDFTDKAQEFNSRLKSAEESLREHAIEQSRNVWDELKVQHDMTTRRVDNELEQIRSSTTDRGSLSTMFQDIASRLSANEDVQEEQVAGQVSGD